MDFIIPSLFFLTFYVIVPVAITITKGGGWARLYSLVSAALAAYWAYLAPAQFLKSMVVPHGEVSTYFEWILDLVTEYGRMVFAAVVFILLYLLQFRFIARLTEWVFGLGGD
ncbi:MAG: hypothetical protein DRJ18_01750 [Candidatus Methanomethylicota archaeon]|nr:MAG: hypothetical protein DRJ18_01750 [Candidatus Verstraetearchaeota archaeon]